MKLKEIIVSLYTGLLISGLCACEKKDMEYGNSNIYFTNSAPRLAMLETISVDNTASLSDTVIQYITVYRSGVVNNLERIDISLEIDNNSVQELITEAGATDPLYQTDLMKRYINSLAATAEMFSIPSTVTIPEGERSVVVPLTLRKRIVLPYRNDYLNYSINDYNNPVTVKDKLLVLGIKITDASNINILESKRFCYFEIVKALTLK